MRGGVWKLPLGIAAASDRELAAGAVPALPTLLPALPLALMLETFLCGSDGPSALDAITLAGNRHRGAASRISRPAE